MIYKYSFGKPMETEAVVVPQEKCDAPVKYLCENKADGVFTYQMDENDVIYGLGENVRGINKRGWLYESRCCDEPDHLETKHSLYASHNFFVVKGKELFGVFLDDPGIVNLDMGYSKMDTIRVIPSGDDFILYIIEGESIKDIVKQFRHMIGRSYIPPKWGFGYQQSRWSYMNEDEVRDVVAKHRESHLPLDTMVLDIDYMERFKDFTIDEKAFPNFADFAQEMKEKHIHLLPIIDAGVKIEDGYDVYEEGVENDYFCKDANGDNFVAGVWPGKVHFPDFLNSKTRTWFGEKYKVLLDQGVEGFWNDMNEPAIFYNQKRLDEMFEKIEEYKGENLDVYSFFEFQELVDSVANNPEDYKEFYHTFEGETVRHDKVHNLYGYNMTRAAGEAFEKLEPDKRILMYSRSSYIGMHRYGGIWMGDNISWWSHLELNMKMLPSLNMCGILYTGSDIGGFNGDTTEDLLMRWIQISMFAPLMRNHSARDTRRQEVYRFSRTEDFKNMLGLRYALIPYLYSEYMKAALRDEMYCRPLAFDYEEDEQAVGVEDQMMIGDSIMIAPIYKQNAAGRYVYLPEEMKMLRMRGADDYEEEELSAGHHYIKAALNEVLIFVRKGKILPLAPATEYVENVKTESLKLISFAPQADTVYELYQDDGESKDYENPENYCILKIK